jgi:hypothetical protein
MIENVFANITEERIEASANHLNSIKEFIEENKEAIYDLKINSK